MVLSETHPTALHHPSSRAQTVAVLAVVAITDSTVHQVAVAHQVAQAEVAYLAKATAVATAHQLVLAVVAVAAVPLLVLARLLQERTVRLVVLQLQTLTLVQRSHMAVAAVAVRLAQAELLERTLETVAHLMVLVLLAQRIVAVAVVVDSTQVHLVVMVDLVVLSFVGLLHPLQV